MVKRLLARVRALLGGEEDRLRAAQAELQQAVAQWKRDAQLRRERLTRHERRYDKLAAAFERTRVELTEQAADLQRTQAELTEQAADLQRTQAELTEQAADLQRTQAELAERTADLERARAEIAGQTANLVQTRASLETANAELQQTRTELDALNAAVASAPAPIDTPEYRALADESVALRRTIDRLETKRRAAGVQHAALTEQAEQRERKRQQLLERYGRLEQQYAQALAGREAAATKIAALTTQSQQRDQKHQALVERYGRLEQQLAQVKTERDAGAAQFAAAGDQLAQREQKRLKLADRYELLTQQLAQEKAQRQALATELAGMREQLQTLHRAHREASGRAAKLDRVQANRDALALEFTVATQKAEARERRNRKVLASYDALTRQLPQILRRLLSVEPLRHVLPRRRAAGVPASERDAATRREARFEAVSDAYRTSEDGFSQVPMDAVQVDGLTWWFPKLAGDRPNRAQVMASQGPPMDLFLQTRELGIGGVMIDIGANIGRTAIPRALLGDAQIIYAAEPEPANYACLVRNVVENNLRGVVLPDRVAIGSHNGSVQLHCGSTFTSHHVVYDNAVDEQGLRRVDVPCYTLDSWLETLAVDPEAVRFVKVDTNGYEFAVLRGAPKLLALRSAVWQLEIAPECLQGFGHAVPALAEQLAVHFTHFVDLSKHASGARIRPVADMAASLEYLATVPSTGKAPLTDLLLYSN